MRAITTAVVAVIGLLVAGLLGLAAAAGLAPPTPATPIQPGSAGGGSAGGIPDGLEGVYRDAAARYCSGLPWEVLAAVGWVESRHARGHADPATGEVTPPIVGPALDGHGDYAAIPDPSSPDGWAHARGPMQILPGTWQRWGTLAPGRPANTVASPDNAWDAIHTAARILCSDRPAITDLPGALYRYNHDWRYVNTVLTKAQFYAGMIDGARAR